MKYEIKHLKNRLLNILSEMFGDFTLCLIHSGITLKTHNDAALLSAIQDGELQTPICKTLLLLGKNNFNG